MYESPIELTFEPMETIAEEISTAIDGQIKEAVVKATRNVHIEVNEEELIRALNYDRGQYEKGYSDGVASRGHITLSDVMDYIDSMSDDDWETLAAFLEYRGWELKQRFKVRKEWRSRKNE